MEQEGIKTNKLFTTSCIALLVTALSFGIRAGIMNDLMLEFSLSNKEMALIAGTAFWGFPVATILGGVLVDIVGMKRLFLAAFMLHFIGIVMTIYSVGFYTLYFSTLFIGVANGTVEAAGNPLVVTLFPNKKTTKLNHFHFWFPAGIVIGTLVSFLFTGLGLGWQLQMALMIIPTLIYGYLFYKLNLPVTERVASGVSTKKMYKSVTDPLFIFMLICMLGTASTELFTNQWMDVLLSNVTEYAILVLAIVATLQAVLRGFAGRIVGGVPLTVVLIASALVSSIGLYLLGTQSVIAIFAGAVVFGCGVAYFWPTMLGFVSEYIPESGALGINLLGGAGFLSVAIYMAIMGGYYDKLISRNLPPDADLDSYRSAEALTKEGQTFTDAQFEAAPHVIQTTNIIPIVLLFAFIGLYFYMRNRKKPKLKVDFSEPIN